MGRFPASTVCTVLVMLILAPPGRAATPSAVRERPGSGPKDRATGNPPAPTQPATPGDTIASAIPITALPYSDSGNSCAFGDDYAPTCGFAAGAPDVVYSLVVTTDVSVDVSLCGSSYDTELYVLQDGPGVVVACNDDSCGLRSELSNLLLAAGHTYYIVVDGYASLCGNYVLNIENSPPCAVSRPAGALLEGEPACATDYVDAYNGGCNSTPPVFSPLSSVPRVRICGTYGGFIAGGLEARDTDWYVIHMPVTAQVHWCVRGEYDTLLGIIDPRGGCPADSFYAESTVSPCTDGCVSAVLSAGDWWLYVSTAGFGPEAGTCSGRYVATFECPSCERDAVSPETWGRLKTAYR